MAKSPKNSGEALLRVILEDPKNVALVLIYADWLEENGREIEANAVRIRKRVGRSSTVSSISDYLHRYPSEGAGSGESWIGYSFTGEGIGSGQGYPELIEGSGNGFEHPVPYIGWGSGNGDHSGGSSREDSGNGVVYGHHRNSEGEGCGHVEF